MAIFVSLKAMRSPKPLFFLVLFHTSEAQLANDESSLIQAKGRLAQGQKEVNQAVGGCAAAIYSVAHPPGNGHGLYPALSVDPWWLWV